MVSLRGGNSDRDGPALCPQFVVRPFRDADVRSLAVEIPRAPETITVEAGLRGFGDTLPGGTWNMPNSGGLASDGLALEGVSFTRNAKPEFGSNSHTFDVVVDLRAWDRILVDLELVVVDGARSLPLGAFTGIAVRCEAKSVSRTFSITDSDFVSFFGGGKAPTLRVKRTAVTWEVVESRIGTVVAPRDRLQYVSKTVGDSRGL